MSKYIERWHSDAFTNQEIAKSIFLDVKKNLKVMPHPFHGWRSVPNQSLKTISINEHGLRDKNINKKQMNCILLGGSVAWGFGASSNENIPSNLIEKLLLEKYNLDVNVINFAEQMHSSFEEMLTFVSVIDEINPEIIISISSSNDIARGFANFYKINDLNIKQLNHFLRGLKYGLIGEEYVSLELLKIILRNFKTTLKVKESNFTYNKPDQSTIPYHLFKNKLDIINQYCEKKDIKVFHFLQPDLIFKKNKSDSELNYLDKMLNQDRKKFIVDNYEIIRSNFFKKEVFSNNIFFIDLLNIFDEVNKTIFFDRVHFSDNGNKILANTISAKIFKNIKL